MAKPKRSTKKKAKHQQKGKQKTVPQSKKQTAVTSSNFSMLPYLALGLTMIVIFFIRVNLLDMPLERDEGGFAYIGQHLLEGESLYQNLYDIKLPGLYYTYAFIMSIFGFTAKGIHIGLLLFNFTATILLFIWIRRLYNDFIATVTAITFVILSVTPNVFGFAAHATQLLLPFALGGLIVLDNALKSKKILLFLGAGVLLGIAFTIKQQSVYFMIFGGLWLIQQRWKDWRTLVKEMGFLVAGSILPYVLIAITMMASGRFDNFWFWTFEWPREFASHTTLEQANQVFQFQFGRLTEGHIVIWLLGLAGLISLFFQKITPAQKFIAAVFALCMAASVATGFHFYQHYFVVFLPALGLLLALGLSYIKHLMNVEAAWAWAVPMVIFLFCMSQVFTNNSSYFTNPNFTELHRTIYGTNPFPESVEIGKYLKSVKQPNDKIIVFGSEPQIPFYADIPSITGHLFIYPATVPGAYTEELKAEVIQQVETEQPRFLVYVQHTGSWLNINAPLNEWMKNYVSTQGYRPIGVVDIFGNGVPTNYVFGLEQAMQYQLQSQTGVLVFEKGS